MRNSERPIQRGQDHLRVIGRVGGPSEPIQALGFEVTRVGTSARISGGPAQSLADTGSPGLLCVEPADAREVRSGVICVRGAGCASRALTPERSAATAPGGTPARPWPLWLWGRGRREGHSRSRQTERFRNGSHRRGPDPLRGQLQAGRQILRSLRRGESAQSKNSFQGTAGRRWSAVRDPADSGGRMKGSTWNGTDGSEQPQLARAFPNRTRPAFRVEPDGHRARSPPGQDRRGEDPWFSLSSP